MAGISDHDDRNRHSGLLATLKCPSGRRCLSRHFPIWHQGLFAKHVGCAAKFNYAQFEKEDYVAKFGKELVDHWEIQMLKDIGKSRSRSAGLVGAGEMWFPVALLLATEDAADGEVSSASVELCGAIGTGKTVLAMQALDLDSYHPHARIPKYSASDYIYLFHEGDDLSKSPLFDTLHIRTHMQKNSVAVRPHARTNREPMNVKAVFLRPRPEQVRLERPANFWARLAFDFSRLFNIWGKEPPKYHTVIFYDTAGELTESSVDLYLARLDRSLGTVAVIVDARDIWGPNDPLSADSEGNPSRTPNGSLQPACDRLTRLVERREASADGEPRCCLVVTMADIAKIPRETRRELCRLAESDSPDDAKARKSFLKTGLRGAPRTGQNSRSVQTLLGFLENPVDEVFFVWTPNPPGNGGSHPQPRTFGLAGFVSWCLKRPISQVVPADRLTDPTASESEA